LDLFEGASVGEAVAVTGKELLSWARQHRILKEVDANEAVVPKERACLKKSCGC
jgi:hypothetical protein